MTQSKTCWVIQKNKDSQEFVNEDLSDYDDLVYANLFDTRGQAEDELDEYSEEEFVRQVKVTFELDKTEKDIEGIAHEIWAVAQLLPGEGILDGVDRIVQSLKENNLD